MNPQRKGAKFYISKNHVNKKSHVFHLLNLSSTLVPTDSDIKYIFYHYVINDYVILIYYVTHEIKNIFRFMIFELVSYPLNERDEIYFEYFFLATFLKIHIFETSL